MIPPAPEIGRLANQNKRFIAFAALVTALIAVASSFLITPVFKAEVLLLNSPAEKRGSSLLSGLGGSGAGLAALAGLNPNSDSNTQEAIAILKSRALIDQFIADKKLLPVLFNERWDAKNGRWKSQDSTILGLFDGVPTANDGYERFNKKIRRVEEDRRSGLVTLSIEWSNPEQSAEWASELVNRANALLRSTAIERSQKSLTFLQEQAKKSSELEVRQAVFKLIDSELKREMFAQVNEDYAFKVIDPPVVPEKKLRPKRSLFAILGFLIGGALSLAFVVRKNHAATQG
ncbi:Wzz/FepE/Etk N-terminal domain-containing protein [Nevskia sp.]|uniref:Wzz/FepE/Etk N-terminal domain-containing protein n=1 Tax=Nevskia sp. TaxID=1929292 RepID=UPI0025EE4A35|nr:Wzz/FepE/Etk N-terminal domain-containing protein [Nevskia sp.]